jgi:ATP-dependent RNA helicase RhlE
MDFNAFDFHPLVAAGITAAGFVTPTPIQAKAIPPVMEGRDVMGMAQTGTGKTAAFVLPILHRLNRGARGHVRALIVAPTRELAEQIHEAIKTLGRQTRLRSVTVYGGVGINPQILKLKRDAEIVVACPGRLLDHIGRETIDLSRLEVLVLDEGDHMFDMGFLPDIRRILKHIPRHRQTLLFSATMPEEIRRLAREALNHPVTVQIGMTAPADTVSHALYPVEQHLKTAMLLELLRRTDTASVLVFTRTKHRAKRLGEKLGKTGYKATSLQGNLSQNRRQEALDGFRNGTFQILVATDVAARGIDVTRVSHVINYDIPDTADVYIHRIGRTGRAARSGEAFTLVTDSDTGMVRAIEGILGGRLEHRTVDGFNYSLPAPRRNTEFARPQGRRPCAAKRAGGREQAAPRPGATKAKASWGKWQQSGRAAHTAKARPPRPKPSYRAQRERPFHLG